MIDNAIFLIVMILVPWLCFKGAKIDDAEREEKKLNNNKKKFK